VSRYVIGVDGGGTKTRAVVLDEAGLEVGRAEGGPAIASARDPLAPAQAVAGTVRAAAAAAGILVPVEVVWAGLSGAGREAARSGVELELSRLGVALTVGVGTDVEAAFHDAFGGGPGILLIAGTGSIAWGRAENGREARVGGWGRHIGDEGSAYAIGVEALRRVARHADGRAPETNLQKVILDHLRFSGPGDLVQWSADASKSQIAALAPVVTLAAEIGDAVAAEILDTAVGELEGHVLTLLETLGPWHIPPRLALGGGLLLPGGPLREAIEHRLTVQRLEVLQRPLDGAHGAASLGRELLPRK
jgi:glucosamine kinase